MDQNNNATFSQEQIERYQLAFELSKEIAEELGFKEAEEAISLNFDLNQNYYFKSIGKEEVVIFAYIYTEYSHISIEFSFTLIAHDVLWLFQKITSDQSAPEVLNKEIIKKLERKKIDILALLNLENSEVDQMIKDATKAVLKLFLNNLHIFTRSSIVDALGHSKLGYFSNTVKPMLKEHWAQLGLPKDFNLITRDELNSVRQYDKDIKKWMLGNKRQFLNLDTLADTTDVLRNQYSTARKAYKKLKKNFELLNRRSNFEEWIEKWKEICIEDYPKLKLEFAIVIENYTPHELTELHLASVFGYDKSTMHKKIIKSRELRTERMKKDG